MHKALVRGFVGRFSIVVAVFLALLCPAASNAGTEPAGSMATERYAHISVALPDGRALIAGGFPASGSNALASAEIFDPITNTFSPTAAMTTARANAGAVLLPDGRVLVVGGVSTTTGSSLPNAEFYSPVTGTWTSVGWNGWAMQSPKVLTLPDGKAMFIAGGFFAMDCTIYDPA
jgi:Galactose oxidase, central domain